MTCPIKEANGCPKGRDGRTELQVEQYLNHALTLKHKRATALCRRYYAEVVDLREAVIEACERNVALKLKAGSLGEQLANAKVKNFERGYAIMKLQKEKRALKEAYEFLLKRDRERVNRKRRLARKK